MGGNNRKKIEQIVSVQPSPSPPLPLPSTSSKDSYFGLLRLCLSKNREKNQIYMSKLHICIAKKKKKNLYQTKSVLPQFRLIGEDDEESAKVMKLFLDDSR